MDVFKKQLGGKIIEFRKKKGLTQRKLAELSELHPTYISSLEKGQRNITFDNIIKITNALDIQLEDLFTTHARKKTNSTTPKKVLFLKLGGTWDMKKSDEGLMGEGIMDDLELKQVERNLEGNEENLMNYFNLKIEKSKAYKKDLNRHLSWVRDIKKLVYGDFISLFSGDSSNYRASLIAPLISHILKRLKNNHNQSILGGIGTDTSDIFLSILDVFLFDKNVSPILISGANRSIGEENSDAPINFYELFATSHLKMKPGAYYVYNHHIYSGTDFLKIDPSEHPKSLEGMMTFYSPHGTQVNLNFLDPLDYNKKRDNSIKNIEIEDWSAKKIFNCMNKIININLGAQNSIDYEIERMRDNRFEAIIIEAHALGNVPFPIRKAAVEAVKKGKLVMIISRCIIGKITNRYFMALINANNGELAKDGNKIINGRKLNSLTAKAVLTRALLEKRDSVSTQDLIDKLSYERNLT